MPAATTLERFPYGAGVPVRGVQFAVGDLVSLRRFDEVLGELSLRLAIGLVIDDAADVHHRKWVRVVDFVLDPVRMGLTQAEGRLFSVGAAAGGCHLSELVHVTSEIADVTRAQRAGCRGVWLNPSESPCPPGQTPDAVISSIAEMPAVVLLLDDEEAKASSAVGLPPHPEPWPDQGHFDRDLLGQGDRRNVADRYRYWREDAIAADLASRAHPFHVAVENWRHDRNIGAVVRNANAFGAAGVHIVGRRRWNRRGAMATDRYLAVYYHDTVRAFIDWAGAEGLVVVGVDNVEGSVPLETTELPERCVLLFGQEGPGLSEGALRACSMVLAIAQYGSTRSVNAGVASGIAMHGWIRQHAGPPPAH